MKKILITIIIFALLPALGIKADELDTTNSQSALGIEPAIVEIVLDPNAPTVRQINIFNLTNIALPMKAIKQSFTPDDKVAIPSDKLKLFDSSSWITISDTDTDFILQPKELKTVTLTINQPADASPGGHYATVYFQPLIPAELVSQKSVYVYARVGVLVFMQTKGDIVESLKIKSFSSTPLIENPPVNFNLTIENDGNTHLLPQGKIKIYDDLQNKLIATIDLDNQLTLPSLDKIYEVEQESNIVIGKISAVAEVNFGANKRIIESPRITVFIFPYKLTLLIAVALIILIRFRKRFIKATLILLGISKRHNFEFNINHKKVTKNKRLNFNKIFGKLRRNVTKKNDF